MGNALISLVSNWKERFTPFLDWMGELKNTKTIKADAIAGLTVALVLVPQSMAYAQLAGLPSYVGLYASFLPVIIASLFGSSRQLATGPVAIVSLMTAASLEPLAIQGAEAYMAYAAILALMVGLFQLSLGLLRMGVLVDFLSHPVVVGFTNAAALIIASSQVSKLFGLTVEKGEHHYETMWNLVLALPDSHLNTMILGIFSLFLLIYIKKVAPKFPNVLAAVVICTVLSWYVDFQSLGGAVVGEVPIGLPSFAFPEVEFVKTQQLIVSAMIIALLGFVEAISVAKAISSQTRQRLSANQELVGQGLANVASSVFHGYAISGSFSRSAVNFTANAKTGLSSIITGIIVAITLLFLTPLLFHLPQATLAAVIIVAVMNLIKFEPIKHAWKVQPHDAIISIIVFVMTLVFAPHLENGIMIGVVLSLGLFLYRTMSPHFIEVARHKDGTFHNAEACGLKTSENVSIFRYDGDLYFANTGYLEGKILNNVALKPNLKVVILDVEAVDQLDATGEEMLEKLADRLNMAGIEFYIARAKQHLKDAFDRSGLTKKVGKHRFFRERTDAVKYAKQRLGDEIDIEPYLRPILVNSPEKTTS